jgi:parallel beta-helix repeat protein
LQKKKTKILNLSLLFVVILLFASFSTTSSKTIIIAADNKANQQILRKNYVNHGPIYIDYDDNFTDPYNFPGAGTPGDPFRIENYNITVSGDYPILFSGNNTKHFVIQNCFLKTDTNIGIYLGKYYDMGEGTVRILNNIITTEYQSSIEMYGGNSSVISGNTIKSYTYGISVEYSFNSFISENNITGGDDSGIYLGYSYNSTIIRNTCINSFFGINTYECYNMIIKHNNCTSNFEGIIIDSGYNNSITNNILVNNDDNGIEADYCDDSVFTNNLFQENSGYGIDIDANSDNNIIHHNAFINNIGGTSQAFDDGANNVWYDDTVNEGNYWYNGTIATSPYAIDGTASSVDPYPLGSMPVIPEYSSVYIVFLIILSFLSISVITSIYRRKKK